MAKKVIVSPKFALQLRDFLKGGLIAVLAAVVPVIQSTIEAGELKFNWVAIGSTALSAFVAYIAKNFLFEPAKVITTYHTNEHANAVAEDIKKA